MGRGLLFGPHHFQPETNSSGSLADLASSDKKVVSRTLWRNYERNDLSMVRHLDHSPFDTSSRIFDDSLRSSLCAIVLIAALYYPPRNSRRNG